MRVRVGDTRLYFDVDGAGAVPDGGRMRERPTLLLVHGGPGADHSLYKPFLSSLTDVVQIVYMDLRGHGRSDESTPDTWNLATWANDVREFCSVLGIERPIVLGASFGSFVALKYAIDHPEHPSRLVLLEAAARFDVASVCQAFGRFGGEPQRAAAAEFFRSPTEESHRIYRDTCAPLYSVAPPDELASARVIDKPQISRHFFSHEAATVDLRNSASRVRCPVLIVNGKRDPVMPVDLAHELAQSLPSNLVELVLIDDAAHDLSVDAPQRVEQLVRQFVSPAKEMTA